MREILFRGKRIDNGKWVFGFYYKTRGIHIILGDTMPDNTGQREYEVDPETVGEYTNMKTKNSEMIFEGDIIKINECHILQKPTIGKIVWMGSGLWCEIKNPITKTWNPIGIEVMLTMGCEVAGNIHDNPELWEASDEH